MNYTPVYKKTFSHGGDRSGATYEPAHEDRDDDGIPVDPDYTPSIIPQLNICKFGGKVGIQGDNKAYRRNPLQAKRDNDRRMARKMKRRAEKEARNDR